MKKSIFNIIYLICAVIINQKSVLSSSITYSFNCGDPNCMACSYDQVNLVCIQCEIGYQLLNNKCQLSICNTQPGKYLADQYQSVCNSCHPSCKYCISDTYNYCTECNQGYYALPSPYSPYLYTCLRCQDPNCKSCDQQGNCQQCMNGYIINNNVCSQCTIQYAATCSSSTQVGSCIKGFTKSDDGKSCVPVDTLCQFGQYANNMICTRCPANCTQCNSNGQCYICEANYYIDTSNLCQPCPSFCNSCQLDSLNNLQCTSCFQGYFLQLNVSNWQCTLIQGSNYITCPTGQYTNKLTNTCLACDSNCLECSQFGDQCLVCFDSINYQIVNGKCQLRCSSENYYQSYDSKKDDDASKVKKLFFNNSPVVTNQNITNNCVNTCKVTNCQKCIFDQQFCQQCSQNLFLNNDGTCVKDCPEGTFQQKAGPINKCLPCARGCLKCNSSNQCSSCSQQYILINNNCQNENISNNPVNNYVNFDGLWMQSCPQNTFRIGNTCLPSKTCKAANFLINGKVAVCNQCQATNKINLDKQSGSGSPNISLPNLQYDFMGKCYETCPVPLKKQQQNAFCQAQCDQKSPFLDWSKDPNCQGNCFQNIAQKIIPDCNTFSYCDPNKYLKIQDMINEGIALNLNNVPNNYCEPCPPGCNQCFYNGQNIPTCLSCLPGFEMYVEFNFQDPQSYTLPDPNGPPNQNKNPKFKYANPQCMQIKPQIKKCSQLKGYFADLAGVFKSDVCIMCQLVNNNNGCDSCPVSSIMLYTGPQQYKCVPYCNSNQLKSQDGAYCYDKPQINLQVDFQSKIQELSVSYNVPNGSSSFTVTATLSATYNLQLTSITCSISLQPLSGINFQISPPLPNTAIGNQVTHTFSLLDPNGNLIVLNKFSQYQINCKLSFQIVDIGTQIFSLDSSTGVNTLSLPTGNVQLSKSNDQKSISYTISVDQWSFAPIKIFSKYNLFEYQVNIQAKNTQNLNIPAYIYNIDNINQQNYPDKYKITSSGFQKFNYQFSVNIENQNYNQFNLQLIVTPVYPQLNYLVQTVTIPLNYSYVEPTTTRKPQPQIMNQIFKQSQSDGNNKPNLTLIKNIADQVYFYRGDLPTNQEIQSNLTFSKQSKLDQQYYLPIQCDSQINCSGNGKCKPINNSNWYSVCICNYGYKGEQCNWTIDDWKQAKQTVKQHISVINESIQNLDSKGDNTQGLNINQIITLLQLWTDQRDLIKDSSFQSLMNIFKTNTLMKIQAQANSQRLQYILDNLIDIVRVQDLSNFQSKQYFEQVIQQIQSLNLQLMNQVNSSSNSTVVIDRSNYKGIVIHNNAFKKMSTNYYNLSIQNSIQFAIPKNMVKSNQYLEIVMKPMDLASSAQQDCTNNCKVKKNLISNPVVITVKDLASGNEIDVKPVLAASPVVFNMTFAIPSLYISNTTNLTCAYWDEKEKDWLTTGVQVLKKFYQNNVLQSIQCSTLHLTEFTIINDQMVNQTEPIINPPVKPFNFDSSYRIYVLVYLCILFASSLIFYIISLFSTSYASELNIGLPEQKKLDKTQIVQGIIPDFIFRSDVIEDDITNDDTNPRSNAELSDKQNNQTQKNNKFFTNKLSQVVPINAKTLIQQDEYPQKNQVVFASNAQDNQASQQFQTINIQDIQSQDNNAISISQQSQKQQNNMKLISKIEYLNGIPSSPENKQNENQGGGQLIPIQNFTKSVQPKHNQYQTIQSSNFLKELNYPMEYKRPQNQLIIRNEPTSNNHQHDDKNMDYIYNNRRFKQNIPTIIEESATAGDSLNQNSLKGNKVMINQNAESQLIQTNIQKLSQQNMGQNQMRIQDLETKSNTNSGEPILHQNQNQINPDSLSNPRFSPLLIDNPPPFINQNINLTTNVKYDVKPYLTIFCWKYNFKNCSSSQRVLYCVTLLGLFIFSSSFYFQYFDLILKKTNQAEYILQQSCILWITFEIINWALISVIHIKRLFINFIICNSQSKKIQFMLNFVNFLISFGFLFFSSAMIFYKHKNKSRKYFFEWIITFSICCVFNIILEYILMKLVCRFKLTFLFLIIKTKRLDS
ncbi:hypothetical protein ABPG74_016697 [Tetrahymena malaccensis]